MGGSRHARRVSTRQAIFALVRVFFPARLALSGETDRGNGSRFASKKALREKKNKKTTTTAALTCSIVTRYFCDICSSTPVSYEAVGNNGCLTEILLSNCETYLWVGCRSI